MHEIVFAVLVAATAAGERDQAVSHFVTTRHCNFEFDYPSNWDAIPLPPNKGTNCSVQVRPKNFKKLMAENDVDVYTIYVSIPGGSTFLNAANEAGFDFYEGSWVTRGRQGAHGEATSVKTNRWSGLRGTATVGCYREHGGYTGLCDAERVVLQNGSNVWSMEGGPQTHDAFEMILSSFHFTELQ